MRKKRRMRSYCAAGRASSGLTNTDKRSSRGGMWRVEWPGGARIGSGVEVSMYLSNLANRGAAPALVSTLAFNEARLKVISENIANAETPGYRTKRLDTRLFQQALRKALDARGGDPNKPFVIDAGRELRTDENGYLRVVPTEEVSENILFHDGTNMSIERQMADLAETRMVHELATSLLNKHFEGLRKAIRGTA